MEQWNIGGTKSKKGVSHDSILPVFHHSIFLGRVIMKIQKNRKNRARGFTLIELLVVIIIIGLLAALVGPRFFGKVGGAKLKTAKAQIEMFGTALDTFRLDIGRYPTTEEGLKALREKPAGAESAWEGPYLPKEIPNDPWGNPYIYRSPGEHGDYDLISLGLDKAEGGEGENQDVVSWKDLAK
jgi:general secretion pathway protein G